MTESSFERAANTNRENDSTNVGDSAAHERGATTPDMHKIISEMQEDRSITGAPNKFFTHEALPGELIRFEPYGDQHVAEMSVAYTERALAEYQEKYGIPVVNHQHYVVGGDHYVRVEKLEGAIPLNRVMQEGVTDPSLAAEISEAGAKLAKHVEDVIKEGGVVNPEHTHLGQFAVLPDRPVGERVVFIDIEALNPQVVPRAELEVGYRHDSAVAALIQLADGVATIKESTPGVALDAVEIGIAQAFDALPAANMPEEVSRVREDVVQAMVLGDRELFDEIAAGTDEAETERVTYWNNYVEQGGLTPEYAATFESPEALALYVATGQEVQGRDLTPEEIAIALERDPHLARAYEGQARTTETLGPDVGGATVPEQNQGPSRDPEDPDTGSDGTPAPAPEPPLPTLPTAGAARELTDDQVRALEALQQGAQISQEISEGRDIDREPGGGISEQDQAQARGQGELTPGVVLEQDQPGGVPHHLTAEGREAIAREAADQARELAEGKGIEVSIPGEGTIVDKAPQSVELTPAQRALELVDRSIHSPTPLVVPEVAQPKQSKSLLDKARGALGLGKQEETHGLSKDQVKEAQQRADLANELWDRGTPKALAASIARGVDPRAHEALVRQLTAERDAQDAKAGIKRSAAEREALARGDALSVIAEGARLRADEQAAQVQARREAAAQSTERPRVPVPVQIPEHVRALIEVSHESPVQREQRLQRDVQALVRERPELAQSLDQAREAVLARWAEDARTAPGRLRNSGTTLGVDKGVDRSR